MKLQQAKALADRVVELLSPHCDTIEIAGSIRREKAEVKDIEVVAIPSKVLIENTFLFNEGTSMCIPIAFSQTIDYMAKSIIKGKPSGRYMQIELKGGAMLDLFLPEPKDYYRQLAIRTGSADYAHNVIANAWTKLGWCGVKEMGLRRSNDCLAKTDATGKKTYTCINPSGELPPMWLSEQEFFDWLKIKYVHPTDRNFEPINH